MKASLFLTLSAAVAAGTIGVAGRAQNTPSDLGDLVGARAAGGETQMQARGYRFVRTNTAGGAKWNIWWSEDQRMCVQVATYDGRYSAINRIPAANCGQSDGYPPPGYTGNNGNGGYPGPGYGNNNGNGGGYPGPGYGNGGGGPGYGGGGGYGDRYGANGSLTLVCYGEGRKPGTQVQTGYVWNPRRNRYEPRTMIANGSQSFDSEVQIQIFRGRGRIHLGGRLVPPINSGGANGWWEIQNLRVDPYRITGNYRLNGLNKPKIDIDRRSGRIRIDGIEHFRGDCDVGDWGAGSPRF